MARRGRKRKMGARVNGRLVQLSDVQRERDVKQPVLNQPHRNGDESQMRENAVGRMIKDCWRQWYPEQKDEPRWSQEDFYTAAQSYGLAYEKVRRVLSSQRPFANEVLPSRDREPTDAEIAEWREKVISTWSGISRAAGAEGSQARKAANLVIIDNPGPDWQAPFHVRFEMQGVLERITDYALAGKKRAPVKKAA